jgi:hypothetical protein
MPPRSWHRAWKRLNWLKRLSGLTLPHSTLDAGVAQWIASCRAIPASPILSPESAAEQTMTDSSSIRSSGCSTKAGLVVSSERTSRGTLTGSSQPSSRHWSDWVAALRLEYGKRPTSAPSTVENDFSSWPTATAHDGRRPGADIHSTQGANLSREAANWPTPTSMSFADSHQPGNCASHNEMLRLHAQWQTPATDSFRSRGGDRKDEMGLDQQARAFPMGTEWPTPATVDATRNGEHLRQMTLDSGARGFRKGISLHHEVANWPTPAARDYKGANSTEHVETNGTGRCHLDQLPNFVEHCWSTPRASDGEKGGPNMSFGAGGTPLPTQAVSFSPQDQKTPAGLQSSETRRVLNPQFVEWLMGWPIGWTVSEPVETGLSHWLPLMRGALSTLCSPREETQGRLL